MHNRADGLPYDGGPGESLLKAQLEGVQLKRTLDAKQDRVFEVAADVMDRPVPAVPSQVGFKFIESKGATVYSLSL